MNSRQRKRIFFICIHEISHAVGQWHTGRKIERLAIYEDMSGESLASGDCSLGDLRMIFLAGPGGQALFERMQGICIPRKDPRFATRIPPKYRAEDTDAFSFATIECLAHDGELPPMLATAKECHDLIFKYRIQIEHLANELYKRGSLSGDECERVFNACKK